MAKQTIGEFLQTLRKTNGYTQQEVADKLGISNKTLSSWETDRAYPDLLSIPALADIYGVTADEILRGERTPATERRNENMDDAEKISEKCERAALKNRYLKFNTQSYSLLIPACAAAIVIIPAMFVSSTAGVVLLVLAVIALVTAVVLHAVFYKNALISADISEDESLSPAQISYIRDIKNTLFRCIKIDGIVYLSASLILFVIGLSDSFSAVYYLTDLTAAICGAAAIVISQKHAEPKPPRQYTEQQIAALESNGKLKVKCVIAAVAACAVIGAVSGVLLFHTFSTTEELYSGSAEMVKRHLQTLVVQTDSNLHEEYGVAAAAYYLDLPEDGYIEPDADYFFDGGFNGGYSYNYDIWQICYGAEKENGDGYTNVVVSRAEKIEIGNITAYNVRYGALYVTDNSVSDGTMTGEGIYFLPAEYFVEILEKDSDIYVLKCTKELYVYEGYVIWGGGVLAAVAVIIPTIVYFARRKKV